MNMNVGNDIIEIARIRSAIERHGQHFLDKIFTNNEKEYCLQHAKSEIHFAGRYAAKEAISKALGSGIGELLHWHDIEIINDNAGKPQVSLSAKAKKTFANPTIILSISHCREYATAVAIQY